MLWVDKHRPSSFQKLNYHEDKSMQLQSLVHGADFPHLLFYGPSGAGKKTRILCILREVFGPGVEKVKIEVRSFKVNSRNVDISLISSAYHIEMNPGEAGSADRVIVQETLKDLAQSAPIRMDETRPAFKVMVLSEVDQMSRGAQQTLRRTMEKYTKSCRLILCCQSLSRVIEPIRSRCLNVRIPAPSEDMICRVLEDVCRRERLVPSHELNGQIARQCNRNLRRAILMLEACKSAKYPFDAQQPVQLTDWEYFIAHISAEILVEQSPKKLLYIRGKLYELLGNCIPPEIILTKLVSELMAKTDASLKAQTIAAAAECDFNLRRGSKAIFHLEAFVARFMSFYKKYLMEMFAD